MAGRSPLSRQHRIDAVHRPQSSIRSTRCYRGAPWRGRRILCAVRRGIEPPSRDGPQGPGGDGRRDPLAIPDDMNPGTLHGPLGQARTGSEPPSGGGPPVPADGATPPSPAAPGDRATPVLPTAWKFDQSMEAYGRPRDFAPNWNPGTIAVVVSLLLGTFLVWQTFGTPELSVPVPLPTPGVFDPVPSPKTTAVVSVPPATPSPLPVVQPTPSPTRGVVCGLPGGPTCPPRP